MLSDLSHRCSRKQSPRRVLQKGFSVNILQIYIRTSIAKVWFQNSCIATLSTSLFHMCVLLYISNNYAVSRREKSKPSKHSSWWRCLEDVFGLRLQKTSSRRLDQEEYIRLTHSLQKTSSRRLHQDQHIRLGHTSSRRPQDIFKTSSRCFENVFKTSSRRFQDVLSS